MFIRFVGINWLAVCVAAVVSESKKAVSAVAAAVVGVGLLCSPIESAQAQSGIPKVTGFCVLTRVADFTLESGWEVKTVLEFDYSSLVAATFEWLIGVSLPPRGPFLDPDGADERGETAYGVMVFYPKDPSGKIVDRDKWIRLHFYVLPGRPTAYVSAWVVDSEGNEYDVDAAIAYVGWNPFE